ncbi:MAG: glycoside hydrolase family 31 protein [Lyngbya sp. HA4199-MV5]|jgi:alpha-glucosidase|nr:glycoside hydrolase family 31 protein [Lyngbya sp. HA4199-MV5]
MLSTKQLSLKVKFFLVSLFYLSYAPKAFRYSRWKEKVERDVPIAPPAETFDQPGKLLRAEPTASGAQFYFEQAELEIYFLKPDFARLDWRPGLRPVPYAIARHTWESVNTYLKETADGWTLTSYLNDAPALQLAVAFDGRVTVLDSQGAIVREELPPQKSGDGWTHQAALRSEEAIYGLGERAVPLNLRLAREVTEKQEVTQTPKTFRMWNYDAAGKYDAGADPMYICIPLYWGLHHQGSYLVFYENSFDAHFTFSDTATATFEGGALRYYIAVGEPQQLLERYTELTGRSPLPPRWALGYHQSHWGYETEEAVRKTYQGFEAHNLPLSVIHLDIDVQVGFRAFTVDPDRFPNLRGFIQELLEHGVQFVTILNPGVKLSRKSNLFLEGRVLDAFCRLANGQLVVAPVWPGWCVFPDFTNPVVRSWWSRQYEFLLDVGVAGFWHDMNEPAAFIAWGDRSLPPRATQHYMEGRGGNHLEAHNVYGLLQAQAAYQSLCQSRPKQRPFIVSRAGWAGLQRYAWTWTGDIECTWTALRQTIATVIGLGLSGIPYSGPDIGGFQGNPSAELYLRWFQMCSFISFCRTHSANNVEDRTPWSYGEPTLSIIRQFLQLRYRLLPYFYTLSWEASQKGYPPVRPVFWLDRTDSTLWNIDDAFLLGDRLLIYPILQDGQRSRAITLPKGQWYHFWDDQLLEGEAILDAPLEQIPVLVKAGTILPMSEGGSFNLVPKQNLTGKHLTLHLYPLTDGASEWTLYTDVGDGYEASRLDRFSMQQMADGLDLDWSSEGDFPFPYESVCVDVHGMEIQHAWVDGETATVQDNRVHIHDRFTHLHVK